MSLISFARGIPGPDLLPIEDFGDCAKAALARDGAAALNYGPPLGYQPLRQWIADRHDVDVARVMITNGSLQAFAFIARHHVAAGAKFFVEAPCYDRSLLILRRLGAEVESVPLTEDGLDLDVLEPSLAATSGPSLLHDPDLPEPERPHALGPNRQPPRRAGADARRDHPRGRPVRPPPLRRRRPAAPFRAGRRRQRHVHVVVFEDGRPRHPCRLRHPPGGADGRDAGARVRELRLARDVRRGHAARVRLARLFDPNVESIQEALHERRDAMTTALARELPEGTSWNEPDGGYFLWVDLPDGLSAESLLAQADEAGVAFIKGPDFFFHGGGESSMRLAFSYERPDAIDEGIARLGRLVRDALAVAA